MGRVFDFIANSGDGVLAVDRRQTIVLWNGEAARILGYPADQILGKKCYQVFCGRDVHGCPVCRQGCAALASAEHLQPAPTTDMEVRTRDGTDIWLNLTTAVVPSLLSVAREFAERVSADSSKAPVSRTVPTRDSGDLTPREREVLTLLASGLSTAPIAERLCISPRTVRNHVNSILGKLGVHTRLEAVAYSIENGLV
jgi:PAS domain S-box-containing protein